MSQHYVEKVLKLWLCCDISLIRESKDRIMLRHHKQLQQSNYGGHPMSRHHNNMAMTLLAEKKTESFKFRDIELEMS